MKTLNQEDIKKILLLNAQKTSVYANGSISNNIIRITLVGQDKGFQKEFQKNLANTVAEYIENELKEDPKNFSRSITYSISEQKNIATISI